MAPPTTFGRIGKLHIATSNALVCHRDDDHEPTFKRGSSARSGPRTFPIEGGAIIWGQVEAPSTLLLATADCGGWEIIRECHMEWSWIASMTSPAKPPRGLQPAPKRPETAAAIPRLGESGARESRALEMTGIREVLRTEPGHALSFDGGPHHPPAHPRGPDDPNEGHAGDGR